MPTGDSKRENIKLKKFTNFSHNRNAKFFFFCADTLPRMMVDTDFQKDFLISINSNEDLRNYLLSTSPIEEIAQNDTDLSITDSMLNYSHRRHQLKKYYKNVARNQNISEVFLEKDLNSTERIQ